MRVLSRVQRLALLPKGWPEAGSVPPCEAVAVVCPRRGPLPGAGPSQVLGEDVLAGRAAVPPAGAVPAMSGGGWSEVGGGTLGGHVSEPHGGRSWGAVCSAGESVPPIFSCGAIFEREDKDIW